MLFSLAGNLSVSLFSTYLNWLYMIYSFSIFGASQINKLNKSMERFLNFPQCVSVLDQLDVRGNFTDLGLQACEVFLGIFHKYWDPDKPFFRFNSYSFISPTHFIEIWRQSVSMDARYENKNCTRSGDHAPIFLLTSIANYPEHSRTTWKKENKKSQDNHKIWA